MENRIELDPLDVTPEENVIDTEEAKRALQAEKLRRQTACAREVNDILQKHRCRIAPFVVISGDGTAVRAEVVALD